MLSVVYEPDTDNAGNVVGWIASILDVTSQRRAEQRTRDDLAAMTRLWDIGKLCTAKNSDLQSCLEQAVDAAIAFTGADKGNLQCRDRDSGTLTIAAQRGFSDQFLEFFREVQCESSSACGAAMNSRQRVMVPDITRSDTFRGQPSLEVMLADGVRAVQSTPLVSSTGAILGMISIHFAQSHECGPRELQLMDLLARQIADLLERRQAEQALRNSDRQKDDFLATLAHELRNPIAALSGSFELLGRVSSLPDAAQEPLAIIGRQVAQMSRLIDDLLDVSRITRGKLQLRREPLELTGLLKMTVGDHLPIAQSRNQRMNLMLLEEPIWVEADRRA